MRPALGQRNVFGSRDIRGAAAIITYADTDGEKASTGAGRSRLGHVFDSVAEECHGAPPTSERGGMECSDKSF